MFGDEGGMGACVVDRLRQLGVPFVFGFHFGGKPETWDAEGAKPKFANKRGLASPDMGDALALTVALPVTGAAWGLPRGSDSYKTDYDLYAEFDDDYWWGDDDDE